MPPLPGAYQAILALVAINGPLIIYGLILKRRWHQLEREIEAERALAASCPPAGDLPPR